MAMVYRAIVVCWVPFDTLCLSLAVILPSVTEREVIPLILLLHCSRKPASPDASLPMKPLNSSPSLMLRKQNYLFTFILCVHAYNEYFACIYVCAPCTNLEGQKKVSDPLELGLQTVVSCYLDAGNWIQSLWKSSQCS